ncbi:MAG: hypothetical protein H8D49_03720 [Dehalococcoidia bacterium]|nr:hypothetical protein [Dehalococcoidia bacterium]MBL7166867.1 hypothetical protein [Dehalococcoidales bacterium]
MFHLIVTELRHHVPFTVLGAASGIVFVIIIALTDTLPVVSGASETVFGILHPLHVVLSAGVTTVMYRSHSRGRILPTILIGYFGSIGIATISDSLVPFLGESLLHLPHAEAHIGFIEMWWVVNPAALLGIALGLWKPVTRFPHAGHVFLSTWASLFHIIMAMGTTVEWLLVLPIFAFLFLAVWLPCCLSDIAFPLLFSREGVHSEEH